MNSLGLEKEPRETRVVVAMSGGVDSSVTAALLHEQGYDVVGITLQLFNYGNAIERPGTCCAGKDIYDARRVADTCGFPHYVLDYEDRFRQDVMENFADTYLAGQTPIPYPMLKWEIGSPLLETYKREIMVYTLLVLTFVAFPCQTVWKLILLNFSQSFHLERLPPSK